jgi:hypothetical protein
LGIDKFAIGSIDKHVTVDGSGKVGDLLKFYKCRLSALMVPVIDPYGLALENYNAIGPWRAE